VDLDMEIFEFWDNNNNPTEEVVRLIYDVLTFSRVMKLCQNLTSMIRISVMITLSTGARLRLK